MFYANSLQEIKYCLKGQPIFDNNHYNNFIMMLVLILSALIHLTLSAYAPDQITTLPGANFQYNFNQYSGYLDASTDGNIQLHYWFVESQGNPSTDPLVLWLNGGPGCSSVDGLLEENGPFSLQSDGTLLPNPYSWNLISNVIYLESPACVGYSYAKDGNCTVNDDGTATENYLALLSFYDKFPEYQNTPFFITGESYAGVYIPTLVRDIVKSTSLLQQNLQGYAIGNGLLDYKLNTNTLLTFGYTHGLYSNALWSSMNAACCPDVQAQCDFLAGTSKSVKCSKDVTKALVGCNNPDLELYDIYVPCYHEPKPSAGRALKHALKQEMMFRGLYEHSMDPHSHFVTQEIPCENVTAAEDYMNIPAVRTALHINPDLGEWEVCSEFGYRQQYTDMASVITPLLSQPQLHVLFYHGDVDSICNFMEGEQFVTENLGLKGSSSWSQWVLANGQIGGWQQSYGPNIQYTTVRDAGHEVPTFKPAEALEMFRAFLLNDYKYPAPL